MSLFRREWESAPAHVERVWLDDLFADASTTEIARFCGVGTKLVAKVQRRFLRIRGMVQVFDHAEYLRRQIPWPLDAASLCHMALERYAERFKSKGRPAGPESAGGASGATGPDGAGRKTGVPSALTTQTVAQRADRPELSRNGADGSS